MIESRHKPIFITGVPRSGTTWVANILGSGNNMRLLTEPDNEKYSFIAKRWKRSLHRFPFAELSTESDQLHYFYGLILKGSYPKNRSIINHILNQLAGYDKQGNESLVILKEIELENGALEPRAPKLLTSIQYGLTKEFWSRKNQLVIKSVHAGLCLPFISHHFQPKIIIIFRHPANIVSSCMELNIHDRDRKIYQRKELSQLLKPYQSQINLLNDPLSFMGLQVGIFYYLWEKQMETNLDWIEITHEELCADPVEQFKSLFEKIGISWTNFVEDKIISMNKPGKGFKTNRVAANLIDKWKNALSTDQIIKIQKGYSILPVKHYAEFQI